MLALRQCFAAVTGVLFGLSVVTSAQHHRPTHDANTTSDHEEDWLPRDIRDFWMRQAIGALEPLLSSPCPFGAFGTVIVNHTRHDDLGDLICIGANHISIGNPTLHGEMAAINNCSTVLTDPDGRWGLTGSQASDAFSDFTLYTTAEPCPMCAAAIRWAGFRECVFGTSIPTLMHLGWPQIRLTSQQIFEHSTNLDSRTKLFDNVLVNETDAYFAWQFNPEHACPNGCKRLHNSSEICLAFGDDESKVRSEM